MTDNTLTLSATQPVFSDAAHQKRAEECIEVLMYVFPSLSELQCAYIAASSTDARISRDTKGMMACFAIMAGPDLKTPVTAEELIAKADSAQDGALSLMLEITPPAGNA